MQQFWCYPGTATCYCWNEGGFMQIFLSPGGNMQIFYALRLRLGLCLRQFFKNFRFFRNLAPGVARGYAPGHKKICIFPQATP
ncbi:hypothetical protein T06_5155 [Trichinella sp. T6]|nr:hypothetical protein T06_5155 [Trichinella sp. T6]